LLREILQFIESRDLQAIRVASLTEVIRRDDDRHDSQCDEDSDPNGDKDGEKNQTASAPATGSA
jgi:hypothetical protein